MTDVGTWGPSGQDPHVHRMPTRACRAGHSPRKCPGQAAFLMGGVRGLFGSICVTWGLEAEHKQRGLGHKGLEGVRMPAKHKGGQDSEQAESQTSRQLPKACSSDCLLEAPGPEQTRFPTCSNVLGCAGRGLTAWFCSPVFAPCLPSGSAAVLLYP